MRRRFALPLVLVPLLAGAGVAAAFTTLPGFRSPSGNIRCFVLPGGRMLLCSPAHADYAAALQGRCLGRRGGGVDWHGFELGATRRGQVLCSGGILYNPSTQRPRAAVLPYGRSWRSGAFTCASRTTGVTCRNRTGHGLFVARASWRVW